jgi:5-deoxy-glucuronate isomerase
MTLLRRRSKAPGAGGLTVRAGPGEVGLAYIHFAAHRLDAGNTLDGDTGANETALVVLGGRCSVRVHSNGTEETFSSVGTRDDVWAKVPPQVVLLTPGARFTVTAASALHLVVTGAPVGEAATGKPRVIGPGDILTEHRGEGQTYRYIHHLLPPSADAARLILVEVYTPGGNWSSFPPHKHDTEDPPRESLLEEVYYFGVNPPTGFALQRVYTPDRGIDETLAPGDGDLVLVPVGYHPVAATPGHECYYLNVMAGPTRAWNFQVDPDYAHLMNWQKPPEAEQKQ